MNPYNVSNRYGSNADAINLREQQLMRGSSVERSNVRPNYRNPVSYQDSSFLLLDQKYNGGNQGHQNVSSQALEYQLMKDPQFIKNSIKFYGADEPTPLTIQISKHKDALISKDPQFQRNMMKFYAADEPPIPKSYQQPSQSSYEAQMQYQKNLQNFYAVNDPPPMVNQQMNQQRRSRQGDQNRVMNDPRFQKNLDAFYAASEPPLRQPITMNKMNDGKILSDPKFHDNMIKFYAANEPTITEVKQRQEALIVRDPKFQQNLNAFYAANDPPGNVKKGPSVNAHNGPLPTGQKTVDVDKYLAITDSSASARNQLSQFFRTRGIEDFDVFSTPGGPFAFQNNPVWIQSLQDYLSFMQQSYNVKELYLISSLDQSNNARAFISQLTTDRRPHVQALQNLKNILESQIRVQFRVSGIILDQRGAAEKVF